MSSSQHDSDSSDSEPSNSSSLSFISCGEMEVLIHICLLLCQESRHCDRIFFIAKVTATLV